MRIPKVEHICAQRKVLLGLSEIGCSSSLTYSFYKTTQQEKPFCSFGAYCNCGHTYCSNTPFLSANRALQDTREDVNWMLCNVAHGES
jgi:hypothetical protein